MRNITDIINEGVAYNTDEMTICICASGAASDSTFQKKCNDLLKKYKNNPINLYYFNKSTNREMVEVEDLNEIWKNANGPHVNPKSDIMGGFTMLIYA